jgi:hypothetical protein
MEDGDMIERTKAFLNQAPALGRAALLAGALAAGLGGCASTYDLTLMPRDSGKLTYGEAQDLGNGQATVSITVGDRIYTGTWVQVTPEQSTSYIGASAWGWRGWGSYGEINHSYGDSIAKALLQSKDGSGMRCDLYGLTGGSGTGKCTDDKGMVYDVQIRKRTKK